MSLWTKRDEDLTAALNILLVGVLLTMVMMPIKALKIRMDQQALAQGVVTAKRYELDRTPRFLVTVRGETAKGRTVTATYETRQKDFDAVGIGDTVKTASLSR